MIKFSIFANGEHRFGKPPLPRELLPILKLEQIRKRHSKENKFAQRISIVARFDRSSMVQSPGQIYPN